MTSYIVLFSLILLLALTIAGWIFSNVALYPKVIKYENTYQTEIDAKRIEKEKFESLPKEEVFINSPFGYKLHGFFFPNSTSNKVIIFVHGITYSLFGSVKYMDMFLRRGFNVLIYDHRFHGLSEGKNCTFGYFEKHDLKACTDWVINKLGKDAVIGVHGESLGAATALQNSAIDPRVAFYIADCPYSDVLREFKIRLKEDYGLPPFPLLNTASLINKIRTGAFYSDISPIKDIKTVHTPILFIHGANDSYIPKEMSIDMYYVKTGPKRLYIAPNADHAEAYWNNRKEYEAVVDTFLKENKII